LSLVLPPRCLETTTTTGTGTYTLAGAVAGYQSFAAVGNGNTCQYYAEAVDANGVPNGDWEHGLGTYTLSGTTLARTTIYASRNADAAVNWGAGTKRVGVTRTHAGTLVVRQPGGTAGAHEWQITHNGTSGTLICRDVSGDNTSGKILWSGTNNWYFGNVGQDQAAAKLNCAGIVFSSGSDNSGIFPISGTAVCRVRNQGDNGDGWLQQTAARSRINANVTNVTTTMANLTGLSATLIAGRKYTGKLIVYVSEGLAADGIKIDFDGGAATMTSFRAHGTIFDAVLLLSAQVSAIATDFVVATITGDSMVEINFSLVCNGAGTFIPRFAKNSDAAGGTLTAYLNSFMWLEDTP